VNVAMKAATAKSVALKKTAIAVTTTPNMGILTKLAKLKAYWVLITGVITLVIVPIVRLLTKKNKKTVDAKAEEVKE
jgi:uncharacterized membrane protein